MMKKLFTFFAVFASIFSSQAQITVTDADFPSAGDNILLLRDTLVSGLSVTPGSNVAQTWDLTSINFTADEVINYSFANTVIANTPDNLFPESNLKFVRNGITVYLKKNNAQISIDGVFGDLTGQGVDFPINSYPNITQMTFPATAGTVYSVNANLDSTAANTFGLPALVDSVRLKRYTARNGSIDAFGNLTTPNGDNYDVLREYVVETVVDTIWTRTAFTGWIMFYSNTTTTHEYNFLANGHNYYIATLTADGQNGNVTAVTYQPGQTISVVATDIEHVNCYGQNDGKAKALGTGGVPPYSYAWSSSVTSTNENAQSLSPGTYTVTITDANSNTASGSFMITEPDSMTFNTVTYPSSANDGKIELTVSGGTPAYSYEWSYLNITSPNISGVPAGDYTVTVTDANGCKKSESYNVMSNVGIDDVVNEYVKLYPNPSTGLISIENQTAQRIDFSIFNAIGAEVSKGTLTHSVQLNLADLNNGMYFIRFNTDKGILTRQLTIQE